MLADDIFFFAFMQFFLMFFFVLIKQIGNGETQKHDRKDQEEKAIQSVRAMYTLKLFMHNHEEIKLDTLLS